MTNKLHITEAKYAAAYLNKTRNRRRFPIKPEDKNGIPHAAYHGATSAGIVEYFVVMFRLPLHAPLATQLIDALIERGFKFDRLRKLYETYCVKHNVPLFSEKATDDCCAWPADFYAGGVDEVHWLDGTESVQIGRWIEARAKVTDETGKHVGIYVRFLSASGDWVNHVIELDDLSNDGARMFQALEAAGYHLSGERKARAALRKLIQGSDVSDTQASRPLLAARLAR